MSGSLNELEKEIEASRARLDGTIDRIQGRLSVSSTQQTPTALPCPSVTG